MPTDYPCDGCDTMTKETDIVNHYDFKFCKKCFRDCSGFVYAFGEKTLSDNGEVTERLQEMLKKNHVPIVADLKADSFVCRICQEKKALDDLVGTVGNGMCLRCHKQKDYDGNYINRVWLIEKHCKNCIHHNVCGMMDILNERLGSEEAVKYLIDFGIDPVFLEAIGKVAAENCTHFSTSPEEKTEKKDTPVGLMKNTTKDKPLYLIRAGNGGSICIKEGGEVSGFFTNDLGQTEKMEIKRTRHYLEELEIEGGSDE
ncbi:MAG: hypothetical protein DRH26_01335 [Deltaproteobacteria bacterium]|nr:MAG: hypothetical protein DRH26_01335 [Deltaproteobacteria bacterium]